jgi:hypothetical protein
MNNKERQKEFDKTYATIASLEKAIEDAGGMSTCILRRHMDLPLREFLAHVAAPNYIRFEYRPNVIDT